MSIGNLNPDNIFETTDLDLASFLVSAKHSTFQGIRQDGRKRVFVLSPIPDEDVISQFVNDDVINIRPARLFDTRRRMVNALGKLRQAAQPAY